MVAYLVVGIFKLAPIKSAAGAALAGRTVGYPFLGTCDGTYDPQSSPFGKSFSGSSPWQAQSELELEVDITVTPVALAITTYSLVPT